MKQTFKELESQLRTMCGAEMDGVILVAQETINDTTKPDVDRMDAYTIFGMVVWAANQRPNEVGTYTSEGGKRGRIKR